MSGSWHTSVSEPADVIFQATVFDLTPEKHVGRFMGKETQTKLVQAVIKMARAYAPSVVLVEGEKAWLKKVPAELRRVQPKRFAPIYKKIVKGFKPGDQVFASFNLLFQMDEQPMLAAPLFAFAFDSIVIPPIIDS